MLTITPNQIEEGMLLAKDVYDINYRLLIPQGERIEKKHIRILKIWGVQEVEIVGTEEIMPDTEALTVEDAVSEAKKAGKRIFQHVDINHPAIMEIYRLSVKHRSGSSHIRQIDLLKEKFPIPDKFDQQIPLRIKTDNIKLPETPLIISELNEVIENPYASSTDIAKIVNKSTGLSALLLRIVNSAFYNFPEKIDSISWAVTLIGTKEIVNLAFGISVMEVFKNIPKEIIDVQSFIRHSLFCGILSRILGAHKNLIQTEQLFVSGLLHDIGRLVMYKYYPEQSMAFLSLKDQYNLPLYQIEQEFGGIKHTQIGNYLMEKWNLPNELVETIFYHHSPSKAREPIKPGIVHIADIIANGLGIGTSGENSISFFDKTAWDKLAISPSLFESVIRQALHQLKFLGIFNQG